MKRYEKALLLALKIGIGTSIAIYIAQVLHLDYAVSAGTVTLLTLMTFKWTTIKLSVARLVSFVLTLLLVWIIFPHIGSTWFSYGFLLTLVVFVSELLGWRATISVNAVVAAHLLTSQDFSPGAVWNEFLLVLIGVVLAVLLNLFHANSSHRQKIISDMRDVENRLQSILRELAAYLSGGEVHQDVWEDVCELKGQLQAYIESASEYQENTFSSHPEYYISYFKMRLGQCQVLHDLRDELVKIRSIPKQAAVISKFMLHLAEYVVEINHPVKQIEYLNQIFEDMRGEELPKTRDEFESRAMLYHILMDLQDFLTYKAHFVDQLDQAQLTRYWNVSPANEKILK